MKSKKLSKENIIVDGHMIFLSGCIRKPLEEENINLIKYRNFDTYKAKWLNCHL